MPACGLRPGPMGAASEMAGIGSLFDGYRTRDVCRTGRTPSWLPISNGDSFENGELAVVA